MEDANEVLAASKSDLRARMRSVRRELPDRAARSQRIVEHLTVLDAVIAADRLMFYDAVVGEVDLVDLVAWAGERGVATAVPEDGVDATWPDVIVVPGTAFGVRGERLGQGGGWYDRFLPDRRADAFTIGVGFDVQLVDVVPIEDHDVLLDCIVTENGPIWPL
ncbi:5-formyltetrahydrofolate cyclo-ligase [Ilumatobacter sp.]|uniref:5-formyltetrahydrofolate cyclo-ligase n=1 Tax=Ilumatobacter sp. TaxID=1967498 RepID=UPI003C39494E